MDRDYGWRKVHRVARQEIQVNPTSIINDLELTIRVHEMNAEVVLQVFLPYHQSPNFPRMLSILTIPKTSRYFAPFDSLIKNAQPLPRSYITQSVSPSRDKSLRLLMDVAGMVQVALADNVVHRGLLAFWSATMVELIESERSGKGVGEGLVKVLVEAFVGIMETPKGGQDVNVSQLTIIDELQADIG
jgi:U3 small nucleolar RNA-associated protein 10